MRRILGIGAFLMLGAAGAAQAGVTGTVTAASDYDFRGISLSAKDPALQASIDYANDSGFYAGIWGSNVDFSGYGLDESVEIDYYLGYTFGPKDGPTYELAFVYYTDPGTNVKIDYAEPHIGVTYKWFNAKLWYAWDYGNTSQSAEYIEGNGTFALPQDFAVVAHAGYAWGDYWKSFNGEYFDYSIGVTKSFGHFNFALKFIDGSDAVYDHSSDTYSGDSKVWLSVATTFPWSKE
jgi:uncharacterized protein (TIGR02001 family)